MNLANKLTMLRVFMIPFFLVALYFLDDSYANLVGLVIFAVASATDWLDGYIARSRNLITNFGKFMDPLADKLLVAAALIYFVEVNMLPAWIVIIIISREFVISGFRLVAATNGKVIAASGTAKIKTASTMIMILFLLLKLTATWAVYLGYGLVAFATIMTIVSMVEYIIVNKSVFHE